MVYIQIMHAVLLILLLKSLYLKSAISICIPDNIACNKRAFLSSIYTDNTNIFLFANLSVDGIFQYHYQLCSHSLEKDTPWLVIDLEYEYLVSQVIILGRNSVTERMNYFIIGLSNYNITPVHGKYELCGQWSGEAKPAANMSVYCSYNKSPSRFIIVQQPKWTNIGSLTVCELQAFGVKYNSSFVCPIGLYNLPKCDKVCHCANGLPCHQITGKCNDGCLSDWHGDACDRYLYEWINLLPFNCVDDSHNISTLNMTSNQMTISKCIDNCFEYGFIFAALYNMNECHCGNEIYNIARKNNNLCNLKCSGNTSEICRSNSLSSYKQFYQVCPPNYFGYKCRFKCRCQNSKCRYPDGRCIEENPCYGNHWIPPTCHIKNCLINTQCEANGVCNSTIINGNEFLYCKCKSGYKSINDSCIEIESLKQYSIVFIIVLSIGAFFFGIIFACVLSYLKNKFQNKDEIISNIYAIPNIKEDETHIYTDLEKKLSEL